MSPENSGSPQQNIKRAASKCSRSLPTIFGIVDTCTSAGCLAAHKGDCREFFARCSVPPLQEAVYIDHTKFKASCTGGRVRYTLYPRFFQTEHHRYQAQPGIGISRWLASLNDIAPRSHFDSSSSRFDFASSFIAFAMLLYHGARVRHCYSFRAGTVITWYRWGWKRNKMWIWFDNDEVELRWIDAFMPEPKRKWIDESAINIFAPEPQPPPSRKRRKG